MKKQQLQQLIEMTVEQYSLSEKQTEYLKSEIKGMEISADETILLKESGEFTEKREIIYQAVLTNRDIERHICYL